MTHIRGKLRRLTADKNVLAYFATSSLVLNGTTLISGVLMLRWVPPNMMGIWQVMLLAEAYASALRMGIPNAMNRELPYLLGRGDKEQGHRIAATALLHALAAGAVVVLGFLAAAVVLGPAGPEWRSAALARGIAAGCGFYFAYLTGTFRSKDSFWTLGTIQFAQAGMVVLMPVFAYRWGFNGLCAHAAVQALGVLCVAHIWRPLRVRPAFDTQSWSVLWRTGSHLFVSGYLLVAVRDMEKLFLIMRGGLTDVGLFAPAVAVMNAMEILPSAVSSYVYPQMSFRFGRSHDPAELGRLTFWTMGTCVALCIPFIALGWVGLPWVVRTLAPQYLPSLAAMRIALLTGTFLSVVAGTSVLRALKTWRLLYVFILFLGVTKIVTLSLLVRRPHPVIGAAFGGLAAGVVAAGAAVVICWLATRPMPEQVAA